MQKARKILDKATAALVGISSAVFAIVVLVVLISIIKRAIFGSPIKGTVEIVQFGVMFCIAIALARTTLFEHHTRVMMLVEALPKIAQNIINVLVRIVSLGVFSLLLYMLVLELQKAAASMRVTEIFNVPYTLVYGALAFSAAATALIVLYQLAFAIFELFTKSDPPAGDESGVSGSAE